MKSRAVLGAVAVIGSVVVSAPAVQAGGGAGAASFNTFFQCQSITGASPGVIVSTHEFDVDDTVINEAVKVGAAVLKCRQVNVKDAAGVFINGDISSTEMKCYSASVKGPKAVTETQTLQDDFFLADPAGVSPALQLLCGPTLTTVTP